MEISENDLLQANATIIAGVLILLSVVYAITPEDLTESATLQKYDFLFFISLIVYIFIASIVFILFPGKKWPPTFAFKVSKIFFISGLFGVFTFIITLAILQE